MPDDYLWDRSGEPEPEVLRWERLLAPYRHAEAAKPLARRRLWIPFAAAAVLILAAAATLRGPTPPPASSWAVAMGEGVARPLRVGETVVTGAVDTARLAAPAFGELRLEAASRLRVLAARGGGQLMALDRGVLHALIWAPPARFAVDTPLARAIDLGCAYRLEVRDDGSGRLTVETGWVAFQAGNRDSFIPAGAACSASRERGPGIPFFEDASPGFRAAVAEWEAQGSGVDRLLAEARPRDALTLWHLLRRTPDARGAVATRLAALVPGVDAAPLAAGDPHAIEAAWNVLGLGDTSWWRSWRRNW